MQHKCIQYNWVTNELQNYRLGHIISKSSTNSVIPWSWKSKAKANHYISTVSPVIHKHTHTYTHTAIF